MTTDALPSRRVLLLAGCFADAAPSMGLAVALASRMRARLEGVLALDPRAEAAALVTVGPRGRAGPAPRGEPLHLACAADARAFRQRLDVVAASASLPWGFRIGTGLPSELALGLRRPRDAVILGHRRFLSLRGPLVSLADSEANRLRIWPPIWPGCWACDCASCPSRRRRPRSSCWQPARLSCRVPFGRTRPC